MVKWLQFNIANHNLLLSLVKRNLQTPVFCSSPQFLLQKTSQNLSMAACMPASGGAQLDSFCICSPIGRKDRMFVLAATFVDLSSNSFDNYRRVNKNLRGTGWKNSNFVLPRHVLHDTALSGRSRDFRLKPQGKDIHLSNSSSLSAGLSAGLSYDGTVNEELPDSATTSTDLKAFDRKPMKLVSGSCYLPHPDKEKTGGEDAHFIGINEKSIGVADGVGGWAELGINAGIYAQQLMAHSAAAIHEEPEGSIDPIRVLGKAHSLTKVLGSSTACIITLTEQGLRAANLGDSGFIVVRDGHTIFQSPPQQHGFNFPYQLEFGNNADHPSSAQVFSVDVATGDVIVAGTDGLFDNLFAEDIERVVGDAVLSGSSPHETANKIATVAQLRAMDKECQTPFSTAARQANIPFYGGKLDDITVVVSYIS